MAANSQFNEAAEKPLPPKAYLILAHPDPNSFNHELATYLQYALQEHSWEVSTCDLYRENWQPLLTQDELDDNRRQQLCKEILAEQEKFNKSELIILVSPLWWGHFPAILKGYLERVLTHGYAFASDSGMALGLLKNKKIFNVQTCGNVGSTATDAQMFRQLLEQYQYHIFDACGFESESFLIQGIPSRINSVYLNAFKESKKRLLRFTHITKEIDP